MRFIVIVVALLLLVQDLQGSQAGKLQLPQQGQRKLQAKKVVHNPCINLSGFEYPDKDIYPTTQEIDYYFSKGINTFRFPLRWEKLQPVLGGSFDEKFFSAYQKVCNYALKKKGYCIIDVHNYGYYNSKPISQSGSPSFANFQDLWTKIANVKGWKSNDHVWFGLMNEPNGFDTYTVKNFMQAGINAVRKTGAKNWVIINGNGYSGAYSWVSQNWYGVANAQAFTGLTDGGLKKIIVDVHSYLDSDNSGSSFTCGSPTLGTERLTAVTSWVRANGYKLMVGETGSGPSQSCLTALDNMLAYISNNNDVALSWCWWAGGKVWKPSYVSLLDPSGGKDKPQMSVVKKYT